MARCFGNFMLFHLSPTCSELGIPFQVIRLILCLYAADPRPILSVILSAMKTVLIVTGCYKILDLFSHRLMMSNNSSTLFVLCLINQVLS